MERTRLIRVTTDGPDVTTYVGQYLEAVAAHGQDSAQARELRTRYGGLPGFASRAEACDHLSRFSKGRRLGYEPADENRLG